MNKIGLQSQPKKIIFYLSLVTLGHYIANAYMIKGTQSKVKVKKKSISFSIAIANIYLVKT